MIGLQYRVQAMGRTRLERACEKVEMDNIQRGKLSLPMALHLAGRASGIDASSLYISGGMIGLCNQERRWKYGTQAGTASICTRHLGNGHPKQEVQT